MRSSLRAGIAIYNDGHYHAAHDAWEDHWLGLESGTDDERLLHGLIQFTAAIYHARNRNWEGAAGLAESARAYLDGLPADYRACNVDGIRTFLDDLAADPALIERRPAPLLAHDGDRLRLVDLDPAAVAIAAGVLAEEWGYDEEPIERAGEYAVHDLAEGRDDSRFISLLYDFVLEDEARGVVYRRLSDHADRRSARENDVEGLFDG